MPAAPRRKEKCRWPKIAQQHGGHHDDCLRRDAGQAQLDQQRQGDGVDDQRGEVDTLETHEVTQHVASDVEHEPSMHHKANSTVSTCEMPTVTSDPATVSSRWST